MAIQNKFTNSIEDTIGSIGASDYRGWPAPFWTTTELEENAVLKEQIRQLRASLYKSEDSVRREELRCLNVWRSSEENAMKVEIAAHYEFNARLKTIYSEFQESRQEDEGSSYRIEELDRFRDLSEEVATHTNMRYQILQIEHEEQMVYAQNIVQTIGSYSQQQGLLGFNL